MSEKYEHDELEDLAKDGRRPTVDKGQVKGIKQGKQAPNKKKKKMTVEKRIKRLTKRVKDLEAHVGIGPGSEGGGN